MDDNQYWVFVNVKNEMRSRKISQAKADLLIQKLTPEEIDNWFAWTGIFRDWMPVKNLVVLKDGTYQLLIKLKGEDSEDTQVEEITEVEAANEAEAISETGQVSAMGQTFASGQQLGSDVNLQQAQDKEIKELVGLETLAQDEFVAEDLTLSNIPGPPSLKGLVEKGFLQGDIFRSTSKKAVRVKQDLDLGTERRGATRHEIQIEVLILSKGLSFRSQTVNLSQTGALLIKQLPEAMAEVPLETVLIFKKGNLNEKLELKGKVLSNRENRRYLTFSNITNEGQKAFDRLINLYFQEISR